VEWGKTHAQRRNRNLEVKASKEANISGLSRIARGKYKNLLKWASRGNPGYDRGKKKREKGVLDHYTKIQLALLWEKDKQAQTTISRSKSNERKDRRADLPLPTCEGGGRITKYPHLEKKRSLHHLEADKAWGWLGGGGRTQKIRGGEKRKTTQIWKGEGKKENFGSSD